MGITIKELNLNLHIGNNNAIQKDETGSKSNENTKDDCSTDEKQHEAIVNETVRSVLEILKEQQER